MIAELLLPTPAEEVEVLAAVTASRHDGEAMLAPAAPHQSFEIVRVLPLANTAAAMGVKDTLYSKHSAHVPACVLLVARGACR
jgi:hypothetical protein